MNEVREKETEFLKQKIADTKVLMKKLDPAKEQEKIDEAKLLISTFENSLARITPLPVSGNYAGVTMKEALQNPNCYVPTEFKATTTSAVPNEDFLTTRDVYTYDKMNNISQVLTPMNSDSLTVRLPKETRSSRTDGTKAVGESQKYTESDTAFEIEEFFIRKVGTVYPTTLELRNDSRRNWATSPLFNIIREMLMRKKNKMLFDGDGKTVANSPNPYGFAVQTSGANAGDLIALATTKLTKGSTVSASLWALIEAINEQASIMETAGTGGCASPATHLLMHPRAWAAFRTWRDNDGRPYLNEISSAPFSGMNAPNILGIPVVTDEAVGYTPTSSKKTGDFYLISRPLVHEWTTMGGGISVEEGLSNDDFEKDIMRIKFRTWCTTFRRDDNAVKRIQAEW